MSIQNDKQQPEPARPKMDPKDGPLFRALETLRSAAWASFNRRSGYEWKFCFAIWTALAVFIGSLVMHPTEPAKTIQIKGAELVGLIVIGLGVLFIHAFWIAGAGHANAIDRRLSYMYEEKMRLLVGIDYKKDVRPIIEPSGNGKGGVFSSSRIGKLSNYSHVTQVAITALLVIGAAFLMWLRAQ